MLLLLPLLLGCIPDDWNGLPYTGPGVPGDTGDTVPIGDGLEGDWVSQGSDLSDLLAGEPFNYVRVDSHFDADGSYAVVGEDADGTTWPLVGTWVAAEGNPGSITLDQTEPYEAVAEGIWQLDGNTLTYEVVQVTPDYGFVPPTPSSGFGTTTGPGLSPGINVQTYRRVAR